MSLRGEDGGVVIIVALSLVAIIGMIVLVVDVGSLLTSRRQMVRAADSAALSGALSCSLGRPGEMQAKADEFASANKEGAVATSMSVVPAGSCGTASGEIRVTYSTPEEMVFAPVLGFPKTLDVKASSNAMWGPSGEVIALPIMVSQAAFERCGFDMSYSGSGPEQTCGIWYDNDEIGNAQWGFLNFYLWNVDAGAHCNNSGSASKTWIVTGEKKNTNYPASTYVCADTGLVASDWKILDSERGKIKYFPIADGQVDKSGNTTVGGKVDKYNVVGFAGLRIVSATKKVGSFPTTQACATTMELTPGQMVPLSAATDPGCPAGAVGATISAPNVMVDGNWAVLGTDYTYDSTTGILTWSGSRSDVTLEFTWTTPGETVTCGGEPRNGSAVCLVVSWPGPQNAGANPTRDGKDFGLRSIRLVSDSQ